MVCTTCAGSGALFGIPTLWTSIETAEPSRLVQADDLPNALYFSLNESPGSGEVIHRQQGPTIEEIRDYNAGGGGAYREGGREGPEASLARNLCKHPEIPEGVRLLRQVLELRRVAAWHVKSRQVKSFYVFGDPLEVLPPNALRAPIVPILAGLFILSTFGAIAWGLTQLS